MRPFLPAWNAKTQCGIGVQNYGYNSGENFNEHGNLSRGYGTVCKAAQGCRNRVRVDRPARARPGDALRSPEPRNARTFASSEGMRPVCGARRSRSPVRSGSGAVRLYGAVRPSHAPCKARRPSGQGSQASGRRGERTWNVFGGEWNAIG